MHSQFLLWICHAQVRFLTELFIIDLLQLIDYIWNSLLCCWMKHLKGCKMVFNGNGRCCHVHWGKDHSECPFISWKDWKASWTGYRWHLVCSSRVFPGEFHISNKVSVSFCQVSVIHKHTSINLSPEKKKFATYMLNLNIC